MKFSADGHRSFWLTVSWKATVRRWIFKLKITENKQLIGVRWDRIDLCRGRILASTSKICNERDETAGHGRPSRRFRYGISCHGWRSEIRSSIIANNLIHLNLILLHWINQFQWKKGFGKWVTDARWRSGSRARLASLYRQYHQQRRFRPDVRGRRSDLDLAPTPAGRRRQTGGRGRTHQFPARSQVTQSTRSISFYKISCLLMSC